jgi:hypothetical protein
MSDRVWRIERTRISTDYQHVTAFSAAAALEEALDSRPDKWLVKRGLADDPNATYVIEPVQTSTA